MLDDTQLYKLCEQYGTATRLWRRGFAGLLPEVFKRQLYKKKGYGSIFEFAAKLAGMSEEHVRRVLNLEKRFSDKPILKSMLEAGEVSINKLARIASIVTFENEKILAEQVKLLPKAAIETLVRDERAQQSKTVPGHTHLQQNLQNATVDEESVQMPKLSREVRIKLLELEKKGIDINQLILEVLQSREVQIAQEKEELSAEAKSTQSRYIPVKIREVLKKEHGDKCSVQACPKLAQEIHHTQRFSVGHSHDPKFLAPLCKEHHVIAHSVDIKFHEARNNYY